MPALRSAHWYAGPDRNAYIHRAWMRRGAAGLDAFEGRPQIAIANTASDLTPCNSHLDEVAETSSGASGRPAACRSTCPSCRSARRQVRPTAMLWRNMAAMAIEEMVRANPVDGVVLLGGCDKTIPALLMAAASVDLPARGRARRADADRHVPRRAARLRHRRLAAVRGGARRHAVAGRLHRLGVVDDPQPGALQHDGYGVDDGAARRGARRGPARHGGHPGGGQPAARPARTRPAGWPWRWSRAGRRPATCSVRRRSATRSSRWPRSAGRPTPSCTCSRSPAGSGYR